MYARHTILHIYGLQPNTTYSKKDVISLKYNNKFRQKINNCQIENKHPANTLLHTFTEQPLVKFTMWPLPCAQENFKGVCCNFVQHQNQKHTQHVFQAI